MKNLKEQVAATILAAHKVTFLTGAGVSTASGIPDYRSLKGFTTVWRPQNIC